MAVLEIVRRMGASPVVRVLTLQTLQRDVYNLVVEAQKARLILVVIERLWTVLVRDAALCDDKVVHHFMQLVEPDLRDSRALGLLSAALSCMALPCTRMHGGTIYNSACLECAAMPPTSSMSSSLLNMNAS